MPDVSVQYRLLVQEAFMVLHKDIRSICEERWKAWDTSYLERLRQLRKTSNPGHSLQPENLNDPCFFFWSIHNTKSTVFPDLNRLGNSAVRDFIRIRNVATHNERPLSDADLRVAIDFADNVRKILNGGEPNNQSVGAPQSPSGPQRPGRRPLPPPPQRKIPRPAPVPPRAPDVLTPRAPIVPPTAPTVSTTLFRADLYTFYVICDRSYSMLGEPMRVLNTELRAMFAYIASDPGVNDRCRVSVSAFSTSAERLVPLSSASDVTIIPEIEASGVTNYGRAFAHLSSIISEDYVALEPAHRLLRPVVFFLTDGSPTDESWVDELTSLCDIRKANPPLVIFCPLADVGAVVKNELRTIPDIVEPVIKQSAGTVLQEVVSETVKSILRSVVATTTNAADETLRLDG